jgi:transposase InsO family protein
MNDVLTSIYYSPSNRGGFSSIQKLYEEAIKIDNSISLHDVKKWLQSQINYSLHKPARRNWLKNRVIVHEINEEFQADLVDLVSLREENDGYCYILNVIDVLSKFAFAYPLKNKSGKEVSEALKKVFDERHPEKLRTDRGKEFNNTYVKKLCKDEKIYHSMSHSPKYKCSVVERFNRTLKMRMFKYFTHIGNNRYIDVLPDFIKSYNSSKHRSIKMAPKDVSIENQDIAQRNLYSNKSVRWLLLKGSKIKSDLKVGDTVRIQNEFKVFDKGYFPNWTDQIYFIKKIVSTSHRPMYILQNYVKKEQPRRYYREELQKVIESSYRIEDIKDTRYRGGVREALVKWVGYNDKYNSWIPYDSIVDIAKA